jgi:hypothetical protein
MTKAAIAQLLPHSWRLNDWPAFVYPGTAGSARYLYRTHRADLLYANAVGRVGKDIVFFGANYGRWLELQRGNVIGIQFPPNLPSQQAKANDQQPAA